MKRSIYILLLLSLSLSLSTTVRAQQPDTTALFDCGERVRIEATPLPGYRFVRWSDGDTARVREVDVDGPIDLKAVFEPLCREPQVPVDRVYDWLLVVNREELLSDGWLTTEASDDSVRWYRIVEPIDSIGVHDPGDEACDPMVMRGFSLALNAGENWQDYYAEVNVDAAKAEAEFMCTTVMRGFPLVRSDLPYSPTPLLPYTQKYEKDGIIYIKRNNQLYTVYGVPIITNY